MMLLPALALVAVAAASADGRADLTAARQSLKAALEAEARAAAEFQRLRDTSALSRADENDYHAFLTRLDHVVRENCRSIAKLKADIGDTSLEPNCERGATPEQLRLSFPNEQTEDERIAVLEQRLGSSLSEFDEMLLREMEQLARTQSGAPDAGTGSGSGDTERLGGADAGDGQAAAAETPGDMKRPASEGGTETASSESSERSVDPAVEAGRKAKADQAGSRKDAKRSGAVSRGDVPGADDDDVIARQLREAAESESDPELREKLWDEYRRYKSGNAK